VKDYDAAESSYLACIGCDPGNAEAFRELGLMYWGRFKKTPEAIDLIEKSLALEESGDGHLFLAMVNQKQDSKRALNEFQKALEIYMSAPEATGLLGLTHCYYASLLAQENRLLEAEEHFLEAIRVDPENETIQRNNTRFQRYFRSVEEDFPAI
jgi:tetratricopeptide (TPR) repeat protein